MDVHQVASARLRRVSQRYTPSRRLLVGLLAGAGRPLSLPDVLQQQPELAQSSAYRNLAVLEQAGVVRRVLGVDDFARYELAEDLTEHHHHLVCLACGSIADFTSSDHFERTLEEELAGTADEAGFRLHAHRLDLVGLCSACA